MSLKVEIPNLPGVTRSISRIPGALGDGLRNASAQARRLLVAELSAYPPERAEQKYIRTEKLKRGWERAVPIAGGKGFQLINSIAYVQFVQGDGQGASFRGRWTPASQIAHDHEEDILQLFEEVAEQVSQPT